MPIKTRFRREPCTILAKDPHFPDLPYVAVSVGGQPPRLIRLEDLRATEGMQELADALYGLPRYRPDDYLPR